MGLFSFLKADDDKKARQNPQRVGCVTIKVRVENDRGRRIKGEFLAMVALHGQDPLKPPEDMPDGKASFHINESNIDANVFITGKKDGRFNGYQNKIKTRFDKSGTYTFKIKDCGKREGDSGENAG